MPRDTLTTERIIRAAIELLDAEGLDGLNMRSLGKRLGSAATAVYWHVESKDNLVRLAVDAVWDELGLPDLDAVDWRTAATAMATDLHEMLTRHPWLGQAFGGYLLYGPGKARFDNHALDLFERAGFIGNEVEQAATTIAVFVLGCALGPAAEVSLTRRLSKDGGDAEKLIAETMAAAGEVAMAFPKLRARLEAPPDIRYAVPLDQSFEFGLTAIIDGFEARLANRR